MVQDIIETLREKQKNHDFTGLSEQFYQELQQKYHVSEVPSDAKVFTEEELNILRIVYRERLVTDSIPYTELRNVLDGFKNYKETVFEETNRKRSLSTEDDSKSS